MMLYLHFPFCLQKCRYCDFLSFPAGQWNQEQITEYLSLLKKEMKIGASLEKAPISVSSVYIGGGTPSLMEGEEVMALLDTVRAFYQLAADAEITLEANPGTVTRQKARLWKQAGVNRISLGAQAFQDPLLKALGRIHNRQEIEQSIYTLWEEGFENLSLDLMFGLPSQTASDFEESLLAAIRLPITHLSCYGLILEEGTYLFDHQKEYAFPEDEEERGMYHRAVQLLEENGFAQYELSNFAKKGYLSRHNFGYWTGQIYLGFGLGAASCFHDARYVNPRDFRTYREKVEDGHHSMSLEEALSKEDQMKEAMILGLRLTQGVSVREFFDRFQENCLTRFEQEISDNMKKGLLEVEEKTGQDQRVRLTALGMDLANQVMMDFL